MSRSKPVGGKQLVEYARVLCRLQSGEPCRCADPFNGELSSATTCMPQQKRGRTCLYVHYGVRESEPPDLLPKDGEL